MLGACLVTAPALRLLLAYALLFGAVVLYGRTHFYRDPGSIFFDKQRAYEQYYTEHRRREARQLLRSYNWTPAGNEQLLQEENAIDGTPGNVLLAAKASRNPQVCVSFLTVQRRGEQYVEESLGSALAGLKPEERQAMHLGLFFAQTDPTEHPTYNASWLDGMIDSSYSYNVSADRFQYLQKLEQEEDWPEKSTYDYTYALQWCQATGAPYVLMLEGDILLADSWFIRVLAALEEIQTRLHLDPSEWLYLRLFNQERSTGWAGRHLGDNHELAITFGVVAIILATAMAAHRTTKSRACGDNATLAIVCAIIVPSAVILFFQAGKSSVLPPRPGLALEDFGCCSQALLYPREQIPALVSSLAEEKSGQYDLMINDYARNNHLRRITLYPILVQHLGVQSTRGVADESRSVWSTAFESLRPAQLRATHEKLFHKIFNPDADEYL